MEFTNQGSSIYHQIHAVYARSDDGRLRYISGKHADAITKIWPKIVQDLRDLQCPHDEFPVSEESQDECVLPAVQTWEPLPSLDGIVASRSNTSLSTNPKELAVQRSMPRAFGIQELRRQGEQQIVGIVMDKPQESGAKADFSRWFIHFILHETRLKLADINQNDRYSHKTVEDVLQIFESTLRNIASHDEWESGGGRNYFKRQLEWFISRNAKIEFCLPAFPCKSSNTLKVAGVDPDLAEEMALSRLDEFVRKVEGVYKPGAKVWIVSDGHVFSDCIGVEDDMVDRYSEALIELNRAIVQRRDTTEGMQLYSLYDLFFGNQEIRSLFRDDFVRNFDICHPLGLPVAEKPELCRKVLMAGCHIETDALRAQIKEQDASILALYRGFSRFMLQDLSANETMSGLTKNKCKKLASEVAFEMISRNQAYSNLVELLFPYHIRLSIHAHKNSGPKFGVKLISSECCRAVESLEGITQRNTTDLLHIPTPWHNTPCRIQGDPMVYITKSEVIHKGIASGEFEGEWIPSKDGRGGFFSLRRTSRPGPAQTETKAARPTRPQAPQRRRSSFKDVPDRKEALRDAGYRAWYLYELYDFVSAAVNWMWSAQPQRLWHHTN